MPRSVWKGALNFGLVNVPVGLYSATQDKTIHFNQFEEGTSDRIRYKKVNERTGQEVPAGRIVKGYDLGGGEYVLLTDEELESAEPTKSHLIEITDFVDLDQIDPIFYRATYYLAPEGEAADKAYALLREVMRKANKVAIGTVVMRNKEYTVAIRPDDEVLKLETMYFADEIRSPSRELPSLPSTGVDGERLGAREVPRHPSGEGGGPDRVEAAGQRDRHGSRGGTALHQGGRPDGGAQRQPRVGQRLQAGGTRPPGHPGPEHRHAHRYRRQEGGGRPEGRRPEGHGQAADADQGHGQAADADQGHGQGDEAEDSGPAQGVLTGRRGV